MKRYFILLTLIFSAIMSAYSQAIDTAIGDISEDSYFESCTVASEGQLSLSDSPSGSNTSTYTPASFASQPFDYKQTAEWGKYKALRAVGWTSFGVGSAAIVGGFLTYLIESSFTGKHTAAGPALMIGGGALTIASVPLLVSAYSYRNKAKKMSLNMGVSHITTPSLTTNTHITPALSFALNF